MLVPWGRRPDRGVEPRALSTPFLLALGSNVGDRLGTIAQGITFLRERLDIEALSRVVESRPWGVTDQPDFLNVVLRGRSDLDPHALLSVCREAERDAGRKTRIRWGPRELDVDVVFFGQERIDTPSLVVPHPRWVERPFVARLVAEVAGDMVDPVSGTALARLIGSGPFPPELKVYARVDHLLEGSVTEAGREVEEIVSSDGSPGEDRSTIPVSARAGGYPVRVGPGVLDELGGLLRERSPAHRYAIVADRTVWDLHGQKVLAACFGLVEPDAVLTFPPGEANKNREEWARLSDGLLAAGLGRDGCVIALGGGVAGDLAGFVAATYMRGIPVVQVPTSLVAMVDSSVGGKTGVDVPGGKNLVGSFHPPKFVLADTDLASTLPREERSQGLAEAVKHGAILDRGYFDRIERAADRLLDGDPNETAVMVTRSVELKAGVVSQDEREAGLRQILNFGHTLGHAFEAASAYRLPHGSAIAIGMVMEARLGERLGVTASGVADDLARALARVGLPTAAPDDTDPNVILDSVSRDKKARSGSPRYVLLTEVGRVDPGDGWSTEVPEHEVRALLADEA